MSERNLKLCEWQYQIVFTQTKYFLTGDIVFLKSNPETKLMVLFIDAYKVYVVVLGAEDVDIIDLVPESILHYCYAGLMIYNREFKICLN